MISNNKTFIGEHNQDGKHLLTPIAGTGSRKINLLLILCHKNGMKQSLPAGFLSSKEHYLTG
jgi:hypothetical protein